MRRELTEEQKARKREYMRRWYVANRERQREYARRWYVANRERDREAGRRWNEANRERRWALNALNSARRRHEGFPFSIDDLEKWLKDQPVCPVFGIKFCLQMGKPSPCTPTIDLLDITGDPRDRNNYALVSYEANALKGRAGPKKLRRLVEWLEGEYKKRGWTDD